MKRLLTSFSVILLFGFIVLQSLRAQEAAAYPTPDEDPEGDTGALVKSQVTTGGSYDVHSGNATRIVNDLKVPGALGEYGLDFTRYWNSLHPEDTNFDAEWPQDLASSGWSHSWRWTAIYGEERPDFGEPGAALRTWTSSITINFPDGHATKFKIVRLNGPPGPIDPRCGPPYSHLGETDWPNLAGPVHDHLGGMAVDGSEFWLSRADGGSVHFVATWSQDENGQYNWWHYQADKIYDRHGFRTDLIYNADGNLIRVEQEGGGRWLTINWRGIGGWALPLIASVESGGNGGQQPQRVTYWYSKLSASAAICVLTRVTYEDEPAPGQTTSAYYTYSFNYGDVENPQGWLNNFPLLKTADDPHYGGAMAKISYKYRGDPCYQTAHPPEPTPSNYRDWFFFARETIAEERNAETGVVVSRFQSECQTGHRRDHNGIGGSRMFFYGRSAEDPEVDSWMGYALTKGTDFGRSGFGITGLPFRKQTGAEPAAAWDGRDILTTRVWGDAGKPSFVGYVDESHCEFNRTDPSVTSPSSAAPDSNRIHNKQHHWLFSKKDERGKETKYRRDERMRVTDIIYPDNSTEHFEYDQFNQIESHRLPSGAILTYHYDQFHRLDWERNSVDFALHGVAADTVYEYDNRGRISTMTEGRGRTSTAQFTVKLLYNGNHQVISEEYPQTGGASSHPTIYYEYDRYGNCTAITDELGHRRVYTYDSYRRCTSFTEPVNDACGVTSRTWNWIYDRVMVDDNYFLIGHFKPSAHTSKEWRVQIGPVFNSVNQRRVTVRTFDVNNRIRSEQTGLVQSGGSSSWHEVQGEEGGMEVHTFTYDQNGQKETFTDGKGRVTHYEYDPRNRLDVTIEDPAPGAVPASSPRVTETDYDETGNKRQVTFPDGEVQKWDEYDAFGQAWKFTDERNNVTDLEYYLWGSMKKLKKVKTYRQRDDGQSDELQETTFEYDELGRAKKTLFPDTSTEESTYEFGQLKTWKTRRGQIKTITDYDARGRERRHQWSGGAAPTVQRVWDDANRLSTIGNGVATIGYDYDDAGQVKVEHNMIDGSGGFKQISYCRFPSGEVSRITYPDSSVVDRGYTARGQVKHVDWGIGTSYVYLPDGKIKYQAYTNGIRTDYGYDGRGMISSIMSAAGSEEIAKRDYWRDDRDRVEAWKRGTIGSQNNRNEMEDGRGDRYDYDEEGQLTHAAYRAQNPELGATPAARTENFNYDKMGNRMGWNDIASRGHLWMTRRDDNRLNQYFMWEDDRPDSDPLHWGSRIYHDDDIPVPPWQWPGNGVTMQDGYVTASFNALNQPVAIWSRAYPGLPSPEYLWFGYDPLGRCVRRWVGPNGNPSNSNPTYYYYDGWNLVQEGTTALPATRTYVHGGRVDEIVASKVYGQWLFHHYDARGHCIMLTDSTGTLVEQYDYDAFGHPYPYDANGAKVSRQNVKTRFLFTGREYLPELRLYDFRHRMYQPELGRFLQPDPKQFEAGDYNLYRYCHNDPVNKSDPTGEFVAIPLVPIVLIAAAGVVLTTPAGQKALQDTGRLIIDLADRARDAISASSRNKPPGPLPEAEGRPHTIIEEPGPDGQYTTHNGDGTSKQYRGSGKPHGPIPRPNVKETTKLIDPSGEEHISKPQVREAKPEEIPGPQHPEKDGN